jgi:phosphatidylserine synthase
MAFPDRFGAARRYVWPFDPSRPEFRYGMRYGVPLMVGWTVLLIWAAFEPTTRRGVLLITVVPVIAGLMLHDANGVRCGELQRRPGWAVRALQLALVALFLSAYFLS